ncbi:MAG TPA: hypothetical protein VF669_16620 [Tepidisphaeraceae bacterium]
MSPESPVTVRTLPSDDPALRPDSPFLEFLLSIGADEFRVSVLARGDGGRADARRLAGRLAFAALQPREREATVTYGGQRNLRPLEVWRLDSTSLPVLHEVLAADPGRTAAWAEDLCVYRAGALLFGTVTHEQYAFVRLSDAEWAAWEAHAHRRAT